MDIVNTFVRTKLNFKLSSRRQRLDGWMHFSLKKKRKNSATTHENCTGRYKSLTQLLHLEHDDDFSAAATPTMYGWIVGFVTRKSEPCYLVHFRVVSFLPTLFMHRTSSILCACRKTREKLSQDLRRKTNLMRRRRIKCMHVK